MPDTKKVAVIGAGVSGLTAIRILKEEGLEPVCFERTGHLGGLWRYHEDDVDGIASVMKTTIINTSKELGASSNFPPPAEYPNYMHNSLMYRYIKDTAEKFDCVRHIEFHQETLKIEKAKDYEETGRWIVTNKNIETGEITSNVFDCVCVCIGHHVFPNEPTFPGQEEFQGKIMHTHSLKKVDSFEDQRVVVVGVGNSGMDAAVELSSVTKIVFLSSRRGAWVVPRLGPRGQPMDAAFIRRYKTFLQSLLPYSLTCHFLEKELDNRFDHGLYNLKPKHRALSQHPTISDTLPIKLLSGAVVVKGAIKRFTKKGVIFENEENETEVNAVILATGYRIKFPFLSDEILKVVDNKVELYKYIYPPELPHPTLAIVGLIQPAGPGFPPMEIQCRWIARIMSGKCNLPSKEEMYADIKQKMDYNRKTFVDSPRHTIQVNFIKYQDELAADIGCKPNLWKILITDPKLFHALAFGPSLPYQYRLQGPHPWSGARDAILTYKERVDAPFQTAGKGGKEFLSKNWFLKSGLVLKLLFILLFAWYFSHTVFVEAL